MHIFPLICRYRFNWNSVFIPLFALFVQLSTSSALADSATEENQFNVGIIIPLSGDLSAYGVAIRNGFEFARTAHPENLSRISYQYEDSRYDGKVALSALNSLRTLHNPNLFYTWGVSPNEALLPVMEANHLATIAETTLKSATVGKSYVIRAARTGEMLAAAILKQLRQRGLKNVGMIAVEIQYYEDIIASMVQQGKEMGISVQVINHHLATDNDIRPSILAAKRAKFDAVGVFLLPGQIVAYYKQAMELHYNPQTFGSDLPDSQELIGQCSDFINGMFFPAVGVTDDFRERYVAAFHDDQFIGMAAQAYDVALLIGDLFNDGKSSNLSSEQIIERISKIGPRSGAIGNFEYTDSREDGKAFRIPVAMKVVENKEIRVLP